MNHHTAALRPCATILFCLLPALIGASSGALAETASAGLAEDLTALAAYEFGMSRAPLQRVSEAVRAASASETAGELEALLAAVLDGEATLEAKRFICRMLGEIGSEACVPAVSRLLAADETFNGALTALETLQNDAATAALAEALVQVAPERRCAVLAALGRQGRLAAVSALAPLLEDADRNLARCAAMALADLNHPEACQAIMNATGGVAPESAPLFADAWLRCAKDLAGTTDPADALALLEQLRTPLFPGHVRIASLSLLMQLEPDRAQSLLFEALGDADPAVATDALMLARNLTGDEVTATLVALLNDAPPAGKPALLAVLTDKGDAAVVPDIQALTDHEAVEVRCAALRALGILGDATSAAFLLERSISATGEEQRTAREALARMADPATNAALLAIATEAGADTLRGSAIAMLAERAAEEARQPLLDLAEKGTPPLRAASVTALRVLATPEMLPALLELALARRLQDIREALPQTLAQTAARISDPEVRADGVIAALQRAEETEAQIVLIETLGLIGNDRAFEAVRTVLASQDIEIRRVALAALARFQRPEALDELLAIVESEADDALRARAYAAYASLLRNASALPLRDSLPHLEKARDAARTVGELRDFLATATQIPARTSLRLIETLLEDEGVKAEALQAALRVSAALVGAWPGEARTRLEALAAQEHTPALAEEARKSLSLMERFEDHIMAWEMAGPYVEEDVLAEALFGHVFPPETDPDTANWRILPLFADANPPYALELDRALGGEERVAYLRTRILMQEEAQPAVLELGTNDGCRVWWNGTLIHSLNEPRALVPGQDKLPVLIEHGQNELVIAVFQHGAAWRASARLVDAAGAPLSGMRYQPGRSESE